MFLTRRQFPGLLFIISYFGQLVEMLYLVCWLSLGLSQRLSGRPCSPGNTDPGTEHQVSVVVIETSDRGDVDVMIW